MSQTLGTHFPKDDAVMEMGTAAQGSHPARVQHPTGNSGHHKGQNGILGVLPIWLFHGNGAGWKEGWIKAQKVVPRKGGKSTSARILGRLHHSKALSWNSPGL